MKFGKPQFFAVVSCALILACIYVPYEWKGSYGSSNTSFTGYDLIFKLGKNKSVNHWMLLIEILVISIIAAGYYFLFLKDQESGADD